MDSTLSIAKKPQKLGPRICPTCGVGFPARNARSTYCSRTCWGEARRGKSGNRYFEPTFNTCQRCGEQFQTGRATGKLRTAKYCSIDCSSEAQRKYYICEHCGESYRSHRGGQKRFCSRECYGAFTRESNTSDLLEFMCEGCGGAFKDFPHSPSLSRVRKRFYCSSECRGHGFRHLKRDNHPNWKGGTFVAKGYVYEADYSRPPKPNGGVRYRRQHIRVAEEKIGRQLAKGEHVHHVNGSTTDNRPENLLVLPQPVHTALHHHFAREYVRLHSELGDLEALTLAFIESHQT